MSDEIKTTEKHFIECCLACPQHFAEMREFVQPEEFYVTAHRQAYEALLKLHDQDRLDVVGFADIAPDLAYSYDISQGTANLYGHAKQIKAAAYKRKINASIAAIMQMSIEKHVEPQELYDAVCELALYDVPGGIDGIIRAGDFFDKLMELHADPRLNLYDTGIPKLDPYYRVKRGDICLIGGIPGSGKSEFLDWMLVNEVMLHGWKFAYFSPENYPIQYHLRKIIEKIRDRSFRRSSSKEISVPEITDAMTYINEHFFWVYPKEQDCTPEGIISKFKYLIRKEKIDGIVIDPWNELDMHRPDKMHETDYIKIFLTKLRRFAREYNLVTYVCVHPHMLEKDPKTGKYAPPSLYQYAGSAHWRNKTDVALCVHRDQEPGELGSISPAVDVYIQKVRFKSVGQIGKVSFIYDQETGRYE